MISLKELNPKNFPVNEEQAKNSLVLLERMNKVRVKWGKPMITTSGLRTLEDHLRIYKEIAEEKKVEFDESKVPMGSAHLKFAAVDISDPDGSLYEWCVANEEFLIEVGLWMEIKDSQKRVHFQISAPKSGNRWFKA